MFNFFKRKKTFSPAAPQFSRRSFAACEVSETLGPWHWDGGFSNQEISMALASMRSHSRDMHKNNGDFKRFITLFTTNVIGHNGFYFKSEAIKGDNDLALDADAAFRLEYHFNRWAKNRKWADVTGVKTFPAICRLAAIHWARDGEAFIFIDRAAQNPYGVSLRIIRPDACPEWLNRQTNDGNVIRNGVEVNPDTFRPVAYWFDARQEDNSVPILWNGRNYNLKRIPARDILHIFTQYDECQTRGVPLSHAALKTGKMLEEFNEAELVAARDEANWLGVFHAPLGREDEIKQLDEDAGEQGNLRRHSRKGHDVVLPQGWNYEAKVPQHPNREVTAFKATMKRDLANAFDVEYANFANDWSGVSYSSVRAGTISERDHWLTLQSDFIDQCCTPFFRVWLESFLSLQASGNFRMSDYNRLSEHTFRGRRWQWVDPMRDVNAAVVAVQNGWKTDAQIAAEYGGDIDDNLEEVARLNNLKKKLGISTTAKETPVVDNEESEANENEK